MNPPVAKKEPKSLKIHGLEITDDYAWMRDREKDASVLKHLTAENEYTESFMGPHKALEETLYREMVGRIKQTDISVPYKMGNHWYFAQTEEGKQYATFLRSYTSDGKDAQVLLDQNEMAEGHEYFSVSNFLPSDDGSLLAFAIDVTGYRQYTLHIKDLTTGELLAESIERVTSVEWSSDCKYIFYAQEDAVSKRTDRIFRHIVGTKKADTLIFHEPDVMFGVAIGR